MTRLHDIRNAFEMLPDARAAGREEFLADQLDAVDVDVANACSVSGRRVGDRHADERGPLFTIIPIASRLVMMTHWGWTPREIALYDRHKGRELTKLIELMQKRLASALRIPHMILFPAPTFKTPPLEPVVIRYPALAHVAPGSLAYFDGI